MKNILYSYLLVMGGLIFISSCTEVKQSNTPGSDYSSYVNPFIGNADNGHTFPGACAPFGLVQASPESGNGSWRYCSGFNFDDDSIYGFSQTHLNGTGVPDLGDIRLLPFSGNSGMSTFRSSYDKNSQKAAPGFYSVYLKDLSVQVEITATPRTALYRYTYAGGQPGRLFVDLQHGLVGSETAVPHRVEDAEINFPDNYTIVGSNHVTGWVEREFFYVLKFDKPYSVKEELKTSSTEKAKRLILDFDLEGKETLQVKVALSTVSVEGAMKAMELENPDWDFEKIRTETRQQWNELFARMKVTGTEEQKTNFYTSLYHLFIQPNNIADVDGYYRGVDNQVRLSATGEYYSTLSLWDTYRAAHPLYTLLTPGKVDNMVRTMLDHHRVQGCLPIWTLWGKENYCMIGNHAIPVIVDAWLKGFRGFDTEEAYRAIKETSVFSNQNSEWDIYNEYGYYPFDLIRTQSVSKTLESAFDDYCVALMAKELGYKEDYETFIKRSVYYKNLFDPETKMMRGKDSKGKWRTPFNSFALSHSETHGGDYTEGNAWQYTWHVQQDVEGLINLMGGKTAFIQKLDSLFYLESPEKVNVLDVTGLIGQYAHGNEPSHHVAYLYNYVDASYKTQELIREIFDRFYLAEPNGLCGNDDCGQMSAWYVFSAMGFYPVNPVGGEYIIGAPQIRKVELFLPEGKSFVMEANGLSETNKYVQKVELNGKPITGFRLHHNDIVQGGNLVFYMTDKPVNH